SGTRAEPWAASSRSSGAAYRYSGASIATPWWALPPVSASRSPRVAWCTGAPASAASCRISRVRSSASAAEARYSARTGSPARSASTTAFRPATTSWPAVFGPRLFGRAWLRFCSAALRLPAGWYGRSSAFGVGPVPRSALRPGPPVPTCGPFLLPVRRTAPGRRELPAIVSSTQAPPGTGGAVLDHHTRSGEPVPQLVGAGEVLGRTRGRTLGDHLVHQHGQRLVSCAVTGLSTGPLLGQRIQTEHVQHAAHLPVGGGHRGIIPCGQRRVGLAQVLVQHRECGGDVQVVVQRGSEPVRQLGGDDLLGGGRTGALGGLGDEA